MKAGLANATAAAAPMYTIAIINLLLRFINISHLERVRDRAGESISPVPQMWERAFSKQRAANSSRHVENRTERVIQEIIQLEDHGRGRRNVQSERRA